MRATCIAVLEHKHKTNTFLFFSAHLFSAIISTQSVMETYFQIFSLNCVSLIMGGQMGTQHEILAWLPQPIKEHTINQSFIQMHIYHCLFHNPDWARWLIPEPQHNCSSVCSTDVDHFWPEGRFALLIWLVFWFLYLCQNHPGLSTLGVYTTVDVAVCMIHTCVCGSVWEEERKNFWCLFFGTYN